MDFFWEGGGELKWSHVMFLLDQLIFFSLNDSSVGLFSSFHFPFDSFLCFLFSLFFLFDFR